MIVGTQKPFRSSGDGQRLQEVLVIAATPASRSATPADKEAEIAATLLRMKAAEEGVALAAEHTAVRGSASRSTSSRSSSSCAATTWWSRRPAAWASTS